MIPIYILHGLKSISHPSRTSVYTFIMEVIPPPSMGRGHGRNNGPHCLYRNLLQCNLSIPNLVYSEILFNPNKLFCPKVFYHLRHIKLPWVFRILYIPNSEHKIKSLEFIIAQFDTLYSDQYMLI